MIESKRIGKFVISDEIINHSPNVAKGIMGECIVIGAKHDENRRLTEYIAISEHFGEAAGNINPPEYKAEIIRRTSGEFNIQWKIM